MKRPEVASAINPDSVLVVDQTSDRDPVEPRSEEETALLALIDGKRTVAEVLQLSRMSGFVAMRRLRALLERRAIKPLARAGTPAGGVAKGERGGLTQDLTAAARTFVANAAMKRPTQTRPGITGEVNPPEPKPAPAPVPAPGPVAARTQPISSPEPKKESARVTPLQGSVAAPLPSVIVAFGDLLENGQRAPTRRLGSADLLVPPPQPAPPASQPPAPQRVVTQTITREAPPVVPEPAPASSSALVPTKNTALIPREGRRKGRRRQPASSSELQAQELWVSLTRRDWQTLAVVAPHSDAAALSVASALAEAGTVLRGKAVDLFVAEGRDTSATGEWNWNGRASRPVILPDGGLPPTADKFDRVVALQSLMMDPRGITLAQNVEAVLLVAEEGVTDLRIARRTIDMIGRDRFVGCVMLSAR